MSLTRTALRLQAIEALLADPVLGPMVGGRVYDSRIAAFDHRDPVPTILVTHEETKGDAWDRQNGAGVFRVACDLTLEIAMNALGEVSVADGAPFERSAGPPPTANLRPISTSWRSGRSSPSPSATRPPPPSCAMSSCAR